MAVGGCLAYPLGYRYPRVHYLINIQYSPTQNCGLADVAHVLPHGVCLGCAGHCHHGKEGRLRGIWQAFDQGVVLGKKIVFVVVYFDLTSCNEFII